MLKLNQSASARNALLLPLSWRGRYSLAQPHHARGFWEVMFRFAQSASDGLSAIFFFGN
jgi:hypothetical protein